MRWRHTLKTCALAMAAILAPGPRIMARTQNSTSPTSHGSGQHDMPGMDMGNGPAMHMGGMHDHAKGKNADPPPGQKAEADAVHSMQSDHHHHMDGSHMHMTPPRKATPEDWARADRIAATLRSSLEPFKDYRVALAQGYRIFMPKLPQPMYHFTNYRNGFLESFTFDPARPTSLLYKKTKDGYRLIGAMYTAGKLASLDELNERIPLGVAQWHAHTNLCLPQSRGAGKVDWTRFGLSGSIATPEACREAGGRFYPQIFGWMVHVYPFEASRDKVWAQ